VEDAVRRLLRNIGLLDWSGDLVYVLSSLPRQIKIMVYSPNGSEGSEGGAVMRVGMRMLRDARRGDRPTAAPGHPSINEIVEEGLIMSLFAARMAVKNRIIVGALREHNDFSTEDYARAAREELCRFARQNEADARRVIRARKKLLKLRWTESLGDYRRGDVRQLALRRRVYEALARALRAVSVNEERVAALVESARVDAGDEIAQALTSRLIAQDFEHEPDYLITRVERLNELETIDIPALLAKRT